MNLSERFNAAIGYIKIILKEHLWLVLIFLVLLINAVFAYHQFIAPPSSFTPGSGLENNLPADGQKDSLDSKKISPLNGVLLGSEEDAKRRPIAVMIDNFPNARPQSGLIVASIVWETLVEGGATRLLGVWQTADDVTIGPVRSAREYYLPWVKEVDAVYSHSGGSPAGLNALKNDPTIDNADEFSNGRAYFRVNTSAPHNLFTSIAKLATLIDDKNWRKEAVITPWPSTDVKLAADETAKRVIINFSSLSAYRVEWRYDEKLGVYFRSQGGAIATDESTRRELTTKNIIVEFAQVKPAPPPAPPEGVVVETVGAGDAMFFRDGYVIKGRWEKPSSGDRTIFTTLGGVIYEIGRGQVWVEVVSQDKKDSVVIES